ncbi:unnamed protein product [Microthlaspi erraticum]|uniref:histone acetyltransferase n=1 Tax=Microthlaspi erraticum TaxID=1685480 RepID=A0A6D2HH27_9BRAS|nr:unnamed protein product [Microthlaspi erraticum]
MMAMPPKRYRGMMPTYLNPEPNHSEIDMLNQQLNILPDLNVVTSEEEVKHLQSRKPRPLHVRSEEEEFFYPWKRQRIEMPPIKLNLPPWNDVSRLPSLRTLPANFSVEKKAPVQAKSFDEEVSSYPRGRCVQTSTVPVSFGVVADKVSGKTLSGCSDITKLDSPLDDDKQHVQGLGASNNVKPARGNVTTVYSFEDLFSSKKETQAVEKPLKLGSGVDVVEHEPMKCDDEQSKCEVNADDTMSLQRPLKHDAKLGFGVDVVEPMKCDEQTKCEVNAADTASLEKRNKRDVSLVERFTEEEIKLHIKSLKEGSIQGGISEMCDLNKEEACQLCCDGVLMFPALPIYCSICTFRIKEKSFYYVPEEKISDAQHQICNPCYNRSRTKFTLLDVSITKAKMLKKNNADNQNIEEWVCCGSCGKWQHQICGLYNVHKDEDKTADYICPYCLLEERKSINKTGFISDNSDLGAKDLPETILSSFIEKRLFRRLKEERLQTAKATGKSINDVSEAEDLTLRVVFSADKSSHVNKAFADLLHKENYPSEFPYRSKAILLFQKIEGVDVCIFALFVQEFGSECSLPNQRSVYIVYLDSVKYFRPERVTSSGEALRTFVYHEILIGYLEYCKLRGFTTGYIWACPPPKGEDYIMYSHPETQQIPNTKKLRQWYVSLLDKAAEQRVATNVTNLYDRFFVSTEESSTCNISAARLPYLEGSFWSCNAELLVQEIEREGNKELEKKFKSLSRRALKGTKSKDGVDVDDAKNILLIQKLDKMIHKNKEDFMVVELNYSCSRCSKAILSGSRWFCEKCKNLQLCERCHEAEQEVPWEHTHTMNGKEKHPLSKAEVNAIPSTTEDNDLIIENSMFESRQAFLGFSQKHNYNFDVLRRAKHSSMMILHHLHTSNKKPHHCSENSSQLTCTDCKKDVSTTIFFPCLICLDFRLCNGCYDKNKILRLLHLFPTSPSANGTPPRTVPVLGIVNALFHAHACQTTATEACSYPKCSQARVLFKHRSLCKINERGSCSLCNNFWKILRIHAYHCQDPNCPIPRCRDLKANFHRNSLRI